MCTIMYQYYFSISFPRAFSSETSTVINSYPIYRRRCVEEGGQCFIRNDGTEVDNRWVVPFNPILSRTFDCHINVEYCHSVKAISYICKYVCKGCDVANISLKFNEIERFLHGWYISAGEAVWRILEFPIHERYPAVRRE